MARSITESDRFGPGHLDPLGAIPVFTAMGFFLVFAVGNLGQPHMLHKFFMLDDPRKLKWMPMIVGVTQTLCVLIWLGIGLAVPSLVASGRLAPLANPDDASPQFLLNFAPEILAGHRLRRDPRGDHVDRRQLRQHRLGRPRPRPAQGLRAEGRRRALLGAGRGGRDRVSRPRSSPISTAISSRCSAPSPSAPSARPSGPPSPSVSTGAGSPRPPRRRPSPPAWASTWCSSSSPNRPSSRRCRSRRSRPACCPPPFPSPPRSRCSSRSPGGRAATAEPEIDEDVKLVMEL